MNEDRPLESADDWKLQRLLVQELLRSLKEHGDKLDLKIDLEVEKRVEIEKAFATLKGKIVIISGLASILGGSLITYIFSNLLK